MSTFSLTAIAAKYKVNTKGSVTSPSGTKQQSSVLNTQKNFYNNYASQEYVQSKQVLVNYTPTIDIVMDYSGSMLHWIHEAQKSMSAIVSQLPDSTKIGFRVFGHDGGGNSYSPIISKIKNITKKSDGSYKVTTENQSYLGNTTGSCSSTKQIVKVAHNDSLTLLNGMTSVGIGGSTPLTLALKLAVDNDFAGLDTKSSKKIILITDGGENCGGNPCAYAQELVKQRKDITVDVVLVSSYSSSLKCVADVTGGKLYTPSDVSSFTTSIYNSMKNATKAVPQQPQTQTQSQPQQQQYEYVDD